MKQKFVLLNDNKMSCYNAAAANIMILSTMTSVLNSMIHAQVNGGNVYNAQNNYVVQSNISTLFPKIRKVR